jgi:hypothetical protein
MSAILHLQDTPPEPRRPRPDGAAQGQQTFYRWLAAAYLGLTALAAAGVALGLLLA